MPLEICALNSGSNGNCYYLASSHEAVLIDAGIPCKEVERRMESLGLKMEKLKAIFISHEHADHIGGLSILSKRYNLPVYITPLTLRNCRSRIEKHLIRAFKSYEPVNIGSLSITAFPKAHDASDPYSFTVSSADTRVGVFTDIGVPCAHLIRHFSECDAAFLESNYDEEMLDRGNYPYFLKNRIRGGKGHLSNRQALDLFQRHRAPHMTHLFLSHLSKNNNCPKLVQQLFEQVAETVKIVVASRFEHTALFQINGTTTPPLLPMAMQEGGQLELGF